MYKGIYIALSGAMLKKRHMDIFAQNIANSNTSGYKKDRISFRDYLIPVDNNPGTIEDGRSMSTISGITTDFSEGTLMRTGNVLDLSINGNGFFALEGNRYTRNGSFGISSEGYLVTRDGLKVLGSGGPISVQGGRIDINNSGEVFVDDISVGKLKIVDFANKDTLKKLSGGIFVSDLPGEELEARISQGYVESSNVDVIKEMIGMINALREFESYQKMIRAFDEATQRTTDEMAR